MRGFRPLLRSLPLLLALTGCEQILELAQPKVSSEMLEAELIKWLAEQGLTATDASCPDNQKLEKGNKLECTCMVEGVEIPVSVEVVDPTDGTVKWEPKYTTVKREQLEQSIVALPELNGQAVDVDCEQAVYVSVPNSKVVCALTTDGKPFVVNLAFTDGEGSYEVDVVPK